MCQEESHRDIPHNCSSHNREFKKEEEVIAQSIKRRKGDVVCEILVKQLQVFCQPTLKQTLIQHRYLIQSFLTRELL